MHPFHRLNSTIVVLASTFSAIAVIAIVLVSSHRHSALSLPATLALFTATALSSGATIAGARMNKVRHLACLETVFLITLVVLSTPAVMVLACLMLTIEIAVFLPPLRKVILLVLGMLTGALMGTRAWYCWMTGNPLWEGHTFSYRDIPAVLLVSFVYLLGVYITSNWALALYTNVRVGPLLMGHLRSYGWLHLLEMVMVPATIVAVQHQWFLLIMTLYPLAVSAQTAKILMAHERENSTDPLTGVGNRSWVEQRFQAITHQNVGIDHTVHLAVLAVGIDQYHDIIETLGHDAADQLLREMGARLQSVVRHDLDVVGHLNGEVFCLLVRLDNPRLQRVEQIRLVSSRLINSLGEDFALNGARVSIQATVGAALYPDHGVSSAVLLPRAEAALRAANEGSRGTVHLYNPDNEVSSPAKLALLGELRDAIDNGEIEVFYQPKLASESGVVSGVEALVRWRHPHRGLIPPMEFIPLAETTGLIGPLTWVVLDQALAQVRRWLEQGWAIGVAVNLAAAQLMDPGTPERIVAALTKHGVPQDMLTLEVTESTLIQDAQQASSVLSQLRHIGVRVSIDDYGTGYSSLSYLQKLSIDELKIDRAFIKNLDEPDNHLDLAIVEYTISLGHRLFLSVVAEGVETATQLQTLRQAGCDVIQGFHYTGPLPSAEITAWLGQHCVPPAAPLETLPSTMEQRHHNSLCAWCGQSLRGHRSNLCIGCELGQTNNSSPLH